MSKYSLFRKKAIAVLFASLCICLSFLMIFNAFNVKTVKADSELISVNGQVIDISSFKTYPLAAVRTEATNPGIRFITGINESVYEELTSATADSDWSVKFGTIITYKSRVDAVEDFTKEQLDTLKSSVTQGSVYVDCVAERFLSNPIEEGNKEFTAVLEVDSRNYKNELTARGYMVVSDGTNEQIYYADYEDFSRNTTWVAKTSIENIVTIEDTKSLETLHEYASVGEDGYNMVKTSNVLTNSGFIKPSSVTTSSISVDDFGNRNDVYTFTQTNNSEKWASRLEPALISPSLSWEGSDGAANALARQKALGLKYLKFDFYYKNSLLGNTDFTLYYPTTSGEHGTVDFKDGEVTSSDYVTVYNQLGEETTVLENGNWYTVIVDISCNLEMDKNDNPQVAIVQNNTNNGVVNPQCFDNVIFYREQPSSIKAPINVNNDSGLVSWDVVDGAVGYNVKVDKYNNGELTTEILDVNTNSINLTSYGECEVSVQAVDSIGATSSFSDICSNRTDVIVDFNGADATTQINGTTTANLPGSTVDGQKYNNDGTVEFNVTSSYQHQNFNVIPTAEIDKERDGIAIRFKIITTGYNSGNTFTFQLVGPSYSENYTTTYNSVDVTVGEWQELILPMNEVILKRDGSGAWTGEGHYEYNNVNRNKLYFTLRANKGQSNPIPAGAILIDDISYVDFPAPETPMNAKLEDGVFTWAVVDNATSYNIKVNQYYNGEVTTTNLTANTNSIDLTQYGECEVSVQAVGLGGTSSFSSICSNRTNVLFDFNAEPSEPIIASTTTANGLTASVVNNVTYNKDGTVKVQVKSSWNNQNFNIIPETKSLDFKAGIAIRFKVESTGYAAGTQLYFQYVEAGYSNAYTSVTEYSTAITIGEWQTLVLTSEQIAASGYYVANSTNAWKLHFTILAVGGNNGNAVANILIDDISYITAE